MNNTNSKQFACFMELPVIHSISSVAMSPYWAEHWHTKSYGELIESELMFLS